MTTSCGSGSNLLRELRPGGRLGCSIAAAELDARGESPFLDLPVCDFENFWNAQPYVRPVAGTSDTQRSCGQAKAQH